MDQAIAELTAKIDALTAQVAYLTEQAQAAERARAERAELMSAMMPIANDAMRLATEQLEEIEPYVRGEDLLRLVKKLVRNGPNFEMLLDQLGSLLEFADIVMPMMTPAFDQATTGLAELEKRGYFTFAQGGIRIMDNIVTAFSEEDVRKLGDNIVLILQTVKEMTQPETMNFVRNTVQVIDREKDAPVETSLLAILGQMRDPNVRRGLAITLRVLRTIGAQTTPQAGNGRSGK
ncbi:MAG TPA: DUF1641 domain-containing protein [Anaerolineae bacterium]